MALRESTLRRLALICYGVFLVGVLAGLYLGIRSHAGDAVFSTIVFAFPTVGVIVLNKRPRTTLGWLMLSMGVITLPVDTYGAYAMRVTNGSWPWGIETIGFWSWTWVPFIGDRMNEGYRQHHMFVRPVLSPYDQMIARYAEAMARYGMTVGDLNDVIIGTAPRPWA